MKLLDKTTLYYFVALIPIYLVSSMLFMFVAKHLNINHVDNNLHEDKESIIYQAKTIHPKHIESELSHDYFIKRISSDTMIEERLETVVIYDTIEDEDEEYRQLTTSLFYDDNQYEIILRNSLVEDSTLLYSIFVLFVVLMVFSMALFLLFNRAISRRIWDPFYSMLANLQSFQVGRAMKLPVVSSNISEFNTLGKELEGVTKRVDDDYMRQKEFIDIVSHELQTPLSVISLHIENLIQHEMLTDFEVNNLEIIQNTTLKMSRMNKALLLLSRINNNQYRDIKQISLSKVVADQLADYKDFLDAKNIRCGLKLQEQITIEIDVVLAEILVGNLIQNAIRHNYQGGQVWVDLTETHLEIKNTGDAPSIEGNQVFDKFVKSTSAESVGLGLSIVKGICELMGFVIEYNYDSTSEIYRVLVDFKGGN